MPVVTAAVMYDCEVIGSSYVLVIHNALYIKEMAVNFIPPIMMRLAGLVVDKCSKFLSENPTETNHSIYFKDHDFRIPLQLQGTISYIPTRRPTSHELRVNEGEYLQMTPSMVKWDPHNTIFADQEASMIDYDGNIQMSQPKLHLLESVTMTHLDDTADYISDSHQMSLMISLLQIDSIGNDYAQSSQHETEWQVIIFLLKWRNVR